MPTRPAGGDADDEPEIPIPAPRPDRPARDRRPAREREPREPRPARAGGKPIKEQKLRGAPVSPPESAGFAAGIARLFIGVGRTAGVRPGDIVGAIANEAGISGRMIGAIEIADRFSIVEVPDDVADEVVGALRSTTIKGRKANVRRAD